MPNKVTRKCMNPVCTAQVSGQHLMCGFHWFSVPPVVQAEVRKRLMGGDRFTAAEFLRSHYIDAPEKEEAPHDGHA